MKDIKIEALTTDINVHVRMDEGISITKGEHPLQLALVDQDGVTHMSEDLAEVLMEAVLQAHKQFWIGQGHLTVIKSLSP